MRPLVWLASYPKSGNTWLRLLFGSYDRDGDGDVETVFDTLGDHAGGSSRADFDELAGIESSELTDAEIDLLLPAVFAQRAAEATRQLVLKVHDAYRRNGAGTPRHPAAVASTVYVVRDPLDVAVSLAHHAGLSMAQAVARLCDADAVLARGGRRGHTQLPQPLGSWSDHVRSWVDEPGLDPHVVRYEDLCHDPAAAFTAVLAYVGRTPDPQRVRRAVAETAFDRLQRLEADHGFREAAPRRTAPFFRRGRPGGGRATLTPPQIDQLVAAHADTMARFGYHASMDAAMAASVAERVAEPVA